MVPPSDMSAKAKARANDVLAYGQRQVDRVVSPPTRQKAYDSVYAFATARPILSSFILVQALFSLLPLLFFAGFVLSTAAAALVCAATFALFWAGVAALFLAPTLFLVSGLALLVWAWALATFLAARWVYQVLPAGARGDARLLRVPGLGIGGGARGGSDGDSDSAGKKVIFRKNYHANGGDENGLDFDVDIKAEAAEVKE
ncbi:hypothetical protein F5X99DRAFT_273322 [Biscogniauxia marginata]|nr:hypothetical protein F5X99DRAFT_273322 [Biscogniauxia marginata]